MGQMKDSMRVEIFTFCENASKKNGVVNILGIFESWQGKEFPLSVPEFYTVIRIRMPKNFPYGRCQFVMIDPDGDPAMPVKDLEIVGPVTNVIIRNRNVKLLKTGVYHAALRTDEGMLSCLPMFVSKKPASKLTLNSNLN